MRVLVRLSFVHRLSYHVFSFKCDARRPKKSTYQRVLAITVRSIFCTYVDETRLGAFLEVRIGSMIMKAMRPGHLFRGAFDLAVYHKYMTPKG